MRSLRATKLLSFSLLNRLEIHLGTRSFLAIFLLTIVLTLIGSFEVYAQSPTTYYVDCTAGKDTNSGASSAQAWKSITKANNAILRPGDKLLFKRGCAWQGPLKAAWNGTADQPILIGAYGSGDLPKIQDSYSGNIQISGSYQVLEYIETTLTSEPNPDPSCNNQPVAWKIGFSFGNTSAYNTVQYSKANRLAIGVYLDYNSHHNKVLHNELTDNHVVWKLDNTQALGAMGVLLHGDYHEIAYNYFSGNGTICTHNGVLESNSIELHGARYSNIHHNTSYNDRVFSELGSSATYPSTDNTYAYNLHVVGPQQSQIGSRFLVTRGQGHANGPVWRTKVYNNTLYHTGADSKGITCQDCGSEVLVVKNNIFWVDREPISSDGPFIEDHNLFWSTAGNPLLNFSKSLPSQVADPSFVNAEANDFHLKSTSLALDAGTAESVASGYAFDLEQVAVPQSSAVDIGAYEVPGTSSPTPVPTPSPTPVVPPLAICSISINHGAIYTGARDVQVEVNVPDATQMLISTDAGFTGATWQPYQTAFNWTLPDTAGRIATLLVYVRFSDAYNTLLCGSQISDDIVYDAVPPTVTVALDGVALAAGQDGVQSESRFGLSIVADDQENGSGVEQMQISLDETYSDATWQPFSPTVLVNAEPGRTIYVRVQDGSGNISPTASVTIQLPADFATELFIPRVSR
jgi:hypothetical protein